MEKGFKLDCAFLHSRLVIQLLSPTMRQITEQKIAAVSLVHEDGLKNTFINSILTDAVLNILKANKVVSLDEKLLKNETLKPGDLVWLEQDFYFKGSVKAKANYDKGIRPAYADFYTTLKRYENLKVSGRFNAEHLFGDTSISTLSGRKTVFMFVYIQEVTDQEIILRPVFIGSKMIGTDSGFSLTTDHLQIRIEDIDEFKKVAAISHSNLNINDNKEFPEDQVKRWFAEILYENNVPKDWGGEKSDLFTNHIHINGERYNAAFLFKGPAQFVPMTVKNLGKNGDQISRLYEEPAEIYILHHCHFVRSEIHKTMRAFSGNFTRITRYCIIDGEDTLRILKAYTKI